MTASRLTASAPITVRLTRQTEGRTEALEFGREVAGVTREQVLPGGYASANVALVPRSVPAAAWLPGADVVIASGAHIYFHGRAGDPGQQSGYLTELPVTGIGFAAATDHTYAAPPDSATLYTSLEALRLVAADVAPDLHIATGSQADDPQGTHRLLDFDGMTLLEALDLLVKEGALGGDLLDWLAFDTTLFLRRRIPPARDQAHYWLARDDRGLSRKPSGAQLVTSLRVGYTVAGAQRYTAWGDVAGATDSGRRPRSRTLAGGELTDASALQMRDTLLARAATPVVPSSIAADGLYTPGGMWTPPASVRVGQYVYVAGDAVPSAIVSVRDSLPPNGLQVELDALPGGFGTLLKRIVSRGRAPSGVQYAAGFHEDNTAAENDAVLKLEIAKCAARGGGVIRIPAGRFWLPLYDTANAVNVPTLSDGISLVGESMDATRLVADAGTANVLAPSTATRMLFLGGAGIRLANLTFDGNKDAITLGGNCATILVRGVDVPRCTNLVVENVTFQNIFATGGPASREGYALGLNGAQMTTIRGCVFRDCASSALSVGGDIDTELAEDTTVDGCIVERAARQGITVFGATRTTINACKISACGDGGSYGIGINVEYSDNTLISNTTTRGNYRHAVQILGASQNTRLVGCDLLDSSDPADWTTPFGGSGELRIGGSFWGPTHTRNGIGQHIQLERCRLVPPVGRDHVNVEHDALHDTGLSIPTMSFSSCMGGNGEGPEYWTWARDGTDGRIDGSVDVPTLTRVKEYAVGDVSDAAVWIETGATGTPLTAGARTSGARATATTLITSTTTDGRLHRTLSAIGSTQSGIHYAYGRFTLPPGEAAGATWWIGYLNGTGTGILDGHFRYTTRVTDIGVWIDFLCFSPPLAGSANVLKISCQDSGTHNIELDYIVEGISDAYGANILGYRKGSGALDFASLAAVGTAGSSAELTLSAPGAVAGKIVTVTPAIGIEAGLVWQGYVSAVDTIAVRLTNMTNAALDPGNRTWYWELRDAPS